MQPLICLTERQMEYLDACARIRDTNRSRIIQRLVTIVLDDQLVGAILDDDGAPEPGRKYRARRKKNTASSAEGASSPGAARSLPSPERTTEQPDPRGALPATMKFSVCSRCAGEDPRCYICGESPKYAGPSTSY